MPRRVRGEGSISREGDRWVAQLSWTDEATGKRYRPKRRAKTRREAAVLLDELRREREQDGAPKRTTSRERLSFWLVRWLALYVYPTLRPKTVRAYHYQVHTYLIPHLGSVQLNRLSAERIQTVLTDLRKTGLSPASVHQTRRVLHTALQRAVVMRVIAWNPVEGTVPPAAGRRESPALDARQVAQLLERTAGSRFHALYTVTVALGLRQGEALGLRWQDVDLEAGVLHVRGQLGPTASGQLEHVPVKTAAGSRVIALPQVALRALRGRAVQQAFEAEGAGWENTGFVFTSARGQPFDARNMYRVYKREVAAAGFPSLTFHALRHTAITLMAAGGVHQRVVMQVVGHTKAALTTEVYTHVDLELQKTAAAAIDAAIGTTKGTKGTRQLGEISAIDGEEAEAGI